MEKRKIIKSRKCKFCTLVINKRLIPRNDNVKTCGIAYYNGKLVHSRCFRQVMGHEEFKEGSVRGNYKLQNIGLDGVYFR